jgi:hypothetical protein
MQGADRIGRRNKRCGEPRACATARASSQSNNPSRRDALTTRWVELLTDTKGANHTDTKGANHEEGLNYRSRHRLWT